MRGLRRPAQGLQAAGQAALVSRLRCCSRSSSRPAPASSPRSESHASIRASATTASWCSPRTSWRPSPPGRSRLRACRARARRARPRSGRASPGSARRGARVRRASSSRANVLRVRRHSARQTSCSVVSLPESSGAPAASSRSRSRRYRSLDSASTTRPRAFSRSFARAFSSPRATSCSPSSFAASAVSPPMRTSRSRAGPSARPSQPISSRSGSDQPESSSGRPARRNARRRRSRRGADAAPRGRCRSEHPGRGGAGARTCRREPHRAPRPAACVARVPEPAPGGRGRARGGAWAQAACGRRAGPAQLLRDPSERALVAADELDLQLAEPTDDPPPSKSATASSTTSAPSTRTVSRRVRSRATGATGLPRAYATSSDASSRGGRAGVPSCSSSGGRRPSGA